MTNKELISLGKDAILKKHKGLYISRYKALFGKEPKCAACSFSKDFKAFRDRVNGNIPDKQKKTSSNMGKYKINNKYRSQILSYSKDGKVYRCYGRDMTDEFAEKFLKHGSKKQIKQREEMFEVVSKDTKKSKKPTKKSKSKKTVKDETESKPSGTVDESNKVQDK